MKTTQKRTNINLIEQDLKDIEKIRKWLEKEQDWNSPTMTDAIRAALRICAKEIQ